MSATTKPVVSLQCFHGIISRGKVCKMAGTWRGMGLGLRPSKFIVRPNLQYIRSDCPSDLSILHCCNVVKKSLTKCDNVQVFTERDN